MLARKLIEKLSECTTPQANESDHRPTATSATMVGPLPDPNLGAKGLPGAEAERQANASPMRGNPDAWRQYVQFDPEGAIDFRSTSQDWQKEQFEQVERMNDAWLQILSGVSDQASYDRAKNKARALFGSLGMRFDDYDVPEQYDPAVVTQARMEATSTKDQLAAIRADRKLEWDMEDDRIDNERMDRNTDSLIDTRAGRLSEYERNNRARAGLTQRGQDLTDERGRRGQDLTDKRARDGVRSQGKKARPVAVDAKGNKMEFDGKKWVPVK